MDLTEALYAEAEDGLLIFDIESGYITDADGRLGYVNPAAVVKSGMSAEALLGKTAFDIFPPDIAQKLRDSELHVITSLRPVESRHLAPTPDGIVREWWVARFPMG